MHSAGVSDSATKADSSVDTATVTANWRYSTPVMPPRKDTGTNTAVSTSATATTGAETSLMACTVAARGSIPSSM